MSQLMTDGDRDEGSGRFTDSYAPEAFLEALRELGGAAGTRDVAEEVGCNRETARRRLTDLERHGKVTRSTVGDAYLWSLVE